MGTAFMYAYPESETEEPTFRGWLVTCKHVVEEEELTLVLMNRRQGDGSQPFKVRNDEWTMHPSADIAVRTIGSDTLEQYELEGSAWAWGMTAIGREGARERGLHEGDEILSVGFPMGFRVEETGERFPANYPLVRGGVLAQVREWLDGKTSTFLIDCPIFEGNSGGPICTVPSAIAIAGTQRQDASRLIGVAKERLMAVDGDADVTKSDAAGTPLDLGIVTSVDCINETIAIATAEAG